MTPTSPSPSLTHPRDPLPCSHPVAVSSEVHLLWTSWRTIEILLNARKYTKNRTTWTKYRWSTETIYLQRGDQISNSMTFLLLSSPEEEKNMSFPSTGGQNVIEVAIDGMVWWCGWLTCETEAVEENVRYGDEFLMARVRWGSGCDGGGEGESCIYLSTFLLEGLVSPLNYVRGTDLMVKCVSLYHSITLKNTCS